MMILIYAFAFSANVFSAAIHKGIAGKLFAFSSGVFLDMLLKQVIAP